MVEWVAAALLISVACFIAATSYTVEAAEPALVKGMSWSFYTSSCPKLESIVKKRLQQVFKKDIGQAAGLLRLHFHDCFVQGCDGSVLLSGSAGGPSEEQGAPPNLSLRQEAFRIIEDLRARVHKQCGRVVSCSDILAVAARDSVALVYTYIFFTRPQPCSNLIRYDNLNRYPRRVLTDTTLDEVGIIRPLQ
ncbi:unnamed protein product [Linum tenue]|uniref:peroxidase n=1 Tax=Linum tenue TaxID=586396 RepID=A0AAV0S1Z9_9ROSI|nr:unnamed protein product [Linum tenue]